MGKFVALLDFFLKVEKIYWKIKENVEGNPHVGNNLA